MGFPKGTTFFERLVRSEALFDCLGAVLAVGPAVYGAHAASVRAEYGWPLFLTAVAILAMAIQVAKAIIKYRNFARKEEVYPLEGCLHTLASILSNGQATDETRFALHVPHSSGQLEQVVDYVGGKGRSKLEGGRGRMINPGTGAIGKAAADGQVWCSARTASNDEEYFSELSSLYGFTPHQARALSPDICAWIAVPIPDQKGRVLAVLYGDSNDPGFFTESRKRTVIHASVGIAFFVGRRYP